MNFRNKSNKDNSYLEIGCDEMISAKVDQCA